MNKCQVDYLLANVDSDPKKLAEDTGLSLKKVKSFLKELEEKKDTEVNVDNVKEIQDYIKNKKTQNKPKNDKDAPVVLTPEQATLNDELRDKFDLKGSNKELMERYKGCVEIRE